MFYLPYRQFGRLSHRRLLVKLKNSSSIIKRLKLERELTVHQGCVNTISWNDNGTTILSGSDDQHLIVTDPFTEKLLAKVHSGHRENIFSAKFLPETNDRQVVSCSGDGVVFHTNLDRTINSHSNDGCFVCHGSSIAYKVRIIPHTPHLFLSCSDDGTVRLYDLRTKSHCSKSNCNEDILIGSHFGITSVDINPMNPNDIVCSCTDSSIRLYDHRKLSTQVSPSNKCEPSIRGLISSFTPCNKKDTEARITSVVFNSSGTELLASYSTNVIYLLDPKKIISREQLEENLNELKNTKQAEPSSINSKKTAYYDKKSNCTNPDDHNKGSLNEKGSGSAGDNNNSEKNITHSSNNRESNVILEDKDEQDDDDEDEDEAMFFRDPYTRHFLNRIRARKMHERRSLIEKNILKNSPSLGLINSYEGHCNTRTMIKENNFWSDNYVLSGSDCGNIFIWNKSNGNIVRVIPADEHVVNCIQPHPLDYPILAASGIDHTIKILSPSSDVTIDDTERIKLAVRSNRNMIEDDPHTMNMSHSLMIQILSSIYQLQHPEEFFRMDDDEQSE